MPKTDATIAFSITDNLSQSIVGMKNSLNSFKNDAQGLQQQLDLLQNTRFQLKHVDLKNAKKQVAEMKRALDELGDAATDADREAAQANFRDAVQNYENVAEQLSIVSRQARQTEKDLLNATGAISKADNRAAKSGGSGRVLSALATMGFGQMASDAAQEAANTIIGSTLGDAGGTLASSTLSGVISGAAMGSLAGPIGAAVGAAIGGGIGLVQGGTQVFQGQDEAFKSYYQGLYEQGQTAADESLTAGSATAAQRELDAIAFNRLLGEGVGDRYLADLRTLAAETPLEYSDLTGMSRALATGFGDSPERMLELMEAIGDAGSAVGVTADDMTMMAQAMSRMNSSGKATLEYLNILQERGVNVIGMLADAYDKTQGEIYDMISKGEINGQDAANIIQAGMESMYGGAMETMAETFSGLTSTLEATMAEIDNARGEGYNAERAGGLQAEIDAYGGQLGQAVENLNAIAGQNEAYLENLSEQYTREALSAVLLGRETSGIFDPEQQAELEDMRAQFVEASAAYENGSQEAGLKMDSLRQQAEALATAAYESSEQYQLVQDTELDLIGAIRENTAALEGWRNSYGISQELSKGLGLQGIDLGVLNPATGYEGQTSSIGGLIARNLTGRADGSHASGLRRVPYDNYAALLHEGERVLTAREAREADRGGSRQITVNIGGTWQVRTDSDVDAIAEAIFRRIELAEQAGVRD